MIYFYIDKYGNIIESDTKHDDQSEYRYCIGNFFEQRLYAMIARSNLKKLFHRIKTPKTPIEKLKEIYVVTFNHSYDKLQISSMSDKDIHSITDFSNFFATEELALEATMKSLKFFNKFILN